MIDKDRGSSPYRFQMTISHLIAAVLISALALGPVVLALRSPDSKVMVAAVAFDLILLPVIIALIVMFFMPPGNSRNWIIVVLCAFPVLLFGVGGFVSSPFVLLNVALQKRDWPQVLFEAYVLVMVYGQIVTQIRKRCPRCSGRRFDMDQKLDPVRKGIFPTGLFTCKNCGQTVRLVRVFLYEYRIEPIEDTQSHGELDARSHTP